MIRKVVTGVLIAAFAMSCVSPKVYKELEDKYANLKKSHRKLENENDDLSKAQQTLQMNLMLYKNNIMTPLQSAINYKAI